MGQERCDLLAGVIHRHDDEGDLTRLEQIAQPAQGVPREVMPELADDRADPGPRFSGRKDRREKCDAQRRRDDGDRAIEESARKDEILGSAVVAPDLESPAICLTGEVGWNASKPPRAV